MKVIIPSMFLILVLISGCIQIDVEDTDKEQGSTEGVVTEMYRDCFPFCEEDGSFEVIVISGVDKTQTVSSKNPVKLVISGVNHKITIERGTDVEILVLSGTDNKVYLPESAQPSIVDSGVNTEIIRY